MYDMYPWDSRADGRHASHTDGRHGQAPAPRDGQKDPMGPEDPDSAALALQVALDRRDNGGAAGSQLAQAGATSRPATAQAHTHVHTRAPMPEPALTRQ